MAKPKCSVKVEITGDVVQVWIDNAVNSIRDVMSVEGIIYIFPFTFTTSLLHCHVDPRYDINEVAKEIEELLTAEVPNVFKGE